MNPRALDRTVKPGQVAVVAAIVFPLITFLLGITLTDGNGLSITAAWLLWVADVVVVVAAAAVHFADKQHAEREAELALTIEMDRIVAEHHQQVGDLY